MKRFLLLLLLTFSILLITNSQPFKISGEKSTIALKLNVDLTKEGTFDLYIGSSAKGSEQAREILYPYNWEKNRNLLGRIPEVLPEELREFVRNSFNDTTKPEDFVKLILGCDSTVKRIIYVNYTNGIGILGWSSLKGNELKPLNFLRAFDNIPALADISINIDSECGIECSELQILHFRLVTKEVLMYSSLKNDLHLIDYAAFSPLGGFVILVVCTALAISLGLYSRRYFRGERLYISIWVVAWAFYFFAFIPFSSYIFIAICAVGIAIASVKVVRDILKSRPKPPKKETVELKEVSEKVEKYLR